jgi:hypothetical protein
MGEYTSCSLHLRVDSVAHWATLHEDDGVVAILASNRCRQAQNEPTSSATCNELKAHCGEMVAFVHDEMTVVTDEVADYSVAN